MSSWPYVSFFQGRIYFYHYYNTPTATRATIFKAGNFLKKGVVVKITLTMIIMHIYYIVIVLIDGYVGNKKAISIKHEIENYLGS